MIIIRRPALIMLLLAVLMTVMAGCSTTSSLADTDLCKYFRQSAGEAAGGETAPFAVEVKPDQHVNIYYVAEFSEGSANFVVLDNAGIPVWTIPIEATSAKSGGSTSPIFVKVESSLPEGNYNIIIAFSEMQKHQICWRVDVK